MGTDEELSEVPPAWKWAPPEAKVANCLGIGASILWPDPEHGPWCLVGHWASIDDRPECIGLELWKGVAPESRNSFRPLAGGPNPIASTDIRLPKDSALRGGLITALRLLWESERSVEAARTSEGAVAMATLHIDAGGTMKHVQHTVGGAAEFVQSGPRRKKIEDRAHFERVAEIYKEAARNRQRPTQAVAKAMNVSDSTATRWVTIARKKYGLLAPTVPGKASDVWSGDEDRRSARRRRAATKREN